MTDSSADARDLLGRLEPDMAREEWSDRASAAESEIRGLLNAGWQVGDLIRMDFGEAHVLVHDALRQQVGGVPHACLLLAARSQVAGEPRDEANEAMPSLLLLRVVGSSILPNDIEMQQGLVPSWTAGFGQPPQLGRESEHRPVHAAPDAVCRPALLRARNVPHGP